MSSVQQHLGEWFTQVFFIAALVVSAIYIGWFHWKETVTGRAVTVLLLAIAGALFGRVLVIWHVIDVQKMESFWDEFFTWIAIISLGAGSFAVIILGWEILRIIFQDSEKKWLCKMFLLGRVFPDESKRARKYPSLFQMWKEHRDRISQQKTRKRDGFQ